MQTRRDRLQAYQYQLKRIMSALLGMEPEAPEQPMRRVRAAMFSGVMVGALACGGVAIYGWLSHSQTRGWQDTTPRLIQIKETGAQYILWEDKERSGENVLYPVTNYTSAQLIMGTGEPDRRTIPLVNADDVPRGPQVGLNEIPSAMPKADRVADPIWTVCNHVEKTASGQARRVDLLVGQASANLGLLGTDVLIVEDTVSENLYMIYEGKRLRISEDALTVLFKDPEEIVKVRPAWLNVLPEAAPLEPIVITEAGDTNTKPVSGKPTVAGQVFETTDGQFFVMTREGLAKITEVQALLLLGLDKAQDPNGPQGEATEIRVADTLQAKAPGDSSLVPEGQPGARPDMFAFDGADPQLCVKFNSNSPNERIEVSVGGSPPKTVKVQPVGGTVTGDSADRVTLPGGRFAVMRAITGGDTDRGSLFILTDNGLKYPVPDPGVLATLGYGGLKPAPVPREIADMIATGPALDPVKARGSALKGQQPAQPEEQAGGN